MEHTFFKLTEQLIGEQPLENGSYMLDVIQVGECPTAQHVPQDAVDEVVEGGRTVAKAEVHNEAPMVASGGDIPRAHPSS